MSCKQARQQVERRWVLAEARGWEKQQWVGPTSTLLCFDLHSTFCHCSDLGALPTLTEDQTIAGFLAAAFDVVVVVAAAAAAAGVVVVVVVAAAAAE